MSKRRLIAVLLVTCAAGVTPAGAYDENPLVVALDIPGPKDSGGGIIVADVNDDRKMDFLVTVPGHLAAYDNSGRRLWIEKTGLGVGGLEGHAEVDSVR